MTNLEKWQVIFTASTQIDSSGIPDRQTAPRYGSHDPAAAIRGLVRGVW
ncbi:MAG: hypothetical protein CM1200mP18_00950 [Gammaproteobacteria bacterium]|nr:MAG: hypothetical protein CM1200mP18_00950 [Gammaproteobacteria bacterium]